MCHQGMMKEKGMIHNRNHFDMKVGLKVVKQSCAEMEFPNLVTCDRHDQSESSL